MSTEDQVSGRKKVLILCPRLTEKGGVAHYYSLLRKHFHSETIDMDFYHTGRDKTTAAMGRLSTFFTDLRNLTGILNQYDLVVLNPSLDAKSLFRDGIFHLVAKRLYRRKTVVFFRGWMPECESLIDRYCRSLFRAVFNADLTLVLCSCFRETLVSWGFIAESIGLETTTYENHDLTCENEISRLVFLSRFAPGKGCLEAIRTIELLAGEFPEIILYLVGDGEQMVELARYVKERHLERNIRFTGWLEGEKKAKLLAQCGIMLFPTGYGEGMPNCILEGMGMGLAIVSRPVAGIVDIVAEGKNGFLVPTLEPVTFAERVKYLLQNRDVWLDISARNRQVARERFVITSVVARLDRLYGSLLQA